MPRDFDGTNDYVRTATGACNITGAFTYACVMKRKRSGSWEALMGFHDSTAATARTAFELRDSDNDIELSVGATSSWTTTLDFTDTTAWYLLAATKGAGTVAPTFYRVNLQTQVLASQAGTGTLPNPTSDASGIMVFGEWEGGDDASIHLDRAAVWNRVLTQAEIEQLAALPQAWLYSAPSALWLFDQSATSQAVVDWSGNGSNQSAISGTTVSAQSPPFGYGDGGWLVIRPQGAVAAATRRYSLPLTGMG